MTENNEDFEVNKKQIRAFCHRATQAGGVLLVAGIRGVGKTRLVDEALNERCITNRQHNGRVQVIREPNNVSRYLIKVDIDPFFPVDIKSLQSDTPLDGNTLALTLMRNIVFGLTSAIDSRYSRRKHGKTMRERLGFWRYWFAFNGLVTGGNYIKSKLIGIWFCLTLLLQHIRYGEHAFNLTSSFHLCLSSMAEILLSSIVSFVMILLVAMTFRWLDWRALAKVSKYLFALVNAHEISKTDEQTLTAKQEITSKLPFLFLIVLPIFLLISATNDGISKLADLKKEFSGLFESLIATLSISAAYVGIKISETKQHNHIQYDQTNSAWIISLLRRYQFLCHRCGLEPVLVLDELDKLEELDDFWQECRLNREKNNPGTSGSTENIRVTPNQNNHLDMFLVALARLKSSLGAEFLWILISGPKLGERLQKHRHKRIDGNLGILATVIAQEVVVDAVCAETAKSIALRKIQYHHQIERSLDVSIDFSDEHDRISAQAQILWIRSYGNLATMIRMIESKDFLALQQSPKALILARAAEYIWQPDQQARYFESESNSNCLELLSYKWSQVWIHSGILNCANRFIKGAVTYDYFSKARLDHEINKHHENFTGQISDDTSSNEQGENKANDLLVMAELSKSKFDSDTIALLSANPSLLQIVGERLLFHHLVLQNKIESATGHFDSDNIRFIE